MEIIKNITEFVTMNFTTVLVVIAICLLTYRKCKEFFSMDKEAQKKAALAIIKEEILKLMSDSELYWSTYESSGQIKRAEVIANIYNKFPVLATIEDQETLIKEIDAMIDAAKPVMDAIINKDDAMIDV